MRSLFSRLVLVFLASFMLTALVLTSLNFVLYRNNYYTERQSSLLEQGRNLADVIAHSRLRTVEDYQTLLQLASSSRTSAYLFDGMGRLVASGYKSTGGNHMPTVDDSFIQAVLMGNEVINQSAAGPGGLLPSDIQVGIPIIRPNIHAAVILEGSDIQSHFAPVLQNYLIAGTITFLFAAIGTFLISRRMVKPIKVMRNAALKMAKGDFSQKVPASGTQDELGQLADAFNRMAEELSATLEMKRQFVANASHELRSPLTSIRGFVAGLLDGTVPENQQKRVLEIVQKETGRLSHLVEDLLELSAVEGEIALVKKPTALSDIVENVQQVMMPQLQNKGIHFQVAELTPSLLVEVDEHRIQQVLVNLIGNCIRFSEADSTIEIQVVEMDSHVKLILRDEGIGIPKDELDKVWERFYKVDQSRSREGSGLGLSIVKRIVESHGESIGIESELGRGTTVWFTIKKAS